MHVSANAKNYNAVREFVYEMVYVLGGGRAAAEAAREAFDAAIPCVGDISVQKSALLKFLQTSVGDDTSPGRCMKAINQAIIAPSTIEAHITTFPGLPFKDSQQHPWVVVVRVYDDAVEVSHLRRQCNMDVRDEDSAFDFTMETAFEFNGDVSQMKDVHIYITDYQFGPKTTETRKSELGQILQANLRPAPPAPPPPVRVVSRIGRRVVNDLIANPPPDQEPETEVPMSVIEEQAQRDRDAAAAAPAHTDGTSTADDGNGPSSSVQDPQEPLPQD